MFRQNKSLKKHMKSWKLFQEQKITIIINTFCQNILKLRISVLNKDWKLIHFINIVLIWSWRFKFVSVKSAKQLSEYFDRKMWFAMIETSYSILFSIAEHFSFIFLLQSYNLFTDLHYNVLRWKRNKIIFVLFPECCIW